MTRMAAALTMVVAAALAPAPVRAGSTAFDNGIANWFYLCAGGQTMMIAIRHPDGTVSQFALAPHQRARTAVSRGDMESWRCGGPVLRTGEYHYVTTTNSYY
jgi:hypothetical protein